MEDKKGFEFLRVEEVYLAEFCRSGICDLELVKKMTSKRELGDKTKFENFIREGFVETGAYKCRIYSTQSIFYSFRGIIREEEIADTKEYREETYFYGTIVLEKSILEKEYSSLAKSVWNHIKMDMEKAKCTKAVRLSSGRYEPFKDTDIFIKIPPKEE